MPPRSQRTARLTGWVLSAPLAALLMLSACGGAASSPEAAIGVPTEDQPALTASVEAPITTAAASSTTAPSSVSISIGPPTTSDAYVPVVAPAAASVEAPSSVPDSSPVAQETTLTTATTTAPSTTVSTEPAPASTAAPTTTSAPAETAPAESSTTATPVPTAPSTTEAAEPVQVVEFRIAPGTGSNPWNSFDNPVRVRVGQILRVHNDDSRAHTIHAGGSPFKHGPRIDPGGFRDHPVLRPHQPVDGSPQVYDHNVGRGAPFWVVADS